MKQVGQSPDAKKGRRKLFWICLGLLLLTFSAFNTVLDNDFVDYDDPGYVTKNPYVLGGLTAESVHWAFTTFAMSNWHPLTWLSHMLDIELFGINPAGHHLVNLLFHMASVVLLFLWFHKTTGALWRSAALAALFAIHPLRVESVAWISERKDMLCGFLGILTLWFYLFYTKKRSIARYLIVLGTFSAGLLAKPMLVTWPFVLLLLDFWPLGRIITSRVKNKKPDNQPSLQRLSFSKTLLEKVPLLLLVVASCILTYLAQKQGGAVSDFEHIPLVLRIGNAAIAYFRYLGKTFWPQNLALLYPLSSGFHPIQIGLALTGFLATGLFSVFQYRSRPWLTVGWLWYCGTLVPVLGLVQVGMQSIADRYTYLPSIGIGIMLAWTAGQFAEKGKLQKISIYIISGLALVCLLALSWIQVYYWKNSLTIFQHTVEVTENNPYIELNYASSLFEVGEIQEAIDLTKKVLHENPTLSKSAAQLGSFYLKEGDFQQAIFYTKQALALPSNKKGEWYSVLAVAYARQEEYDSAEHYFRLALTYNPDDPDILNDLGYLYKQQGQTKKAVIAWEQALNTNPYALPVLQNMAWTLATNKEESVRNPEKALYYAHRLEKIYRPISAHSLDILAAVWAANGNLEKAVRLAQAAQAASKQEGNDQLSDEIRRRLDGYRLGKPFYE